jgi:signal transduction histidine kinase
VTASAPRSSSVRWSVRVRILASILVVTALGMTAAAATAFLVQRERILADIDDRLVSHVESARALLNDESGPEDTEEDDSLPSVPPFDDADEALALVITYLVPGRNESALGIVSGSPRFTPSVVTDFHLETIPGFVDRVVAETEDESVVLGTVVHDGREYRYIASPVVVEQELLDEKSPEASIYVDAIDVGGELGPLNSTFTTFAVVAGIALVIVAVVGWFVAGRLLRPIRRLRQAASRITATDLDERIPVEGRDDVSDLTETVNGMLDRLDDAMTSQRRLLDDVRHELKTPITIVRGHLELMDPTDAEDVASVKMLAVDELDRMAALVDDIEALAEIQLAPERRAVDVADFTEEVFAKASVIPGHRWELAQTAHATVSIDARRITQAWLQLADNAAKYSPSGSIVRLGSSSGGGWVEFWVSDQGPGIPADAQERIFERFGRADTGRGVRGSGLGLAIVKGIANAHGGSVDVTSDPRGSRFGIRVPGVEARVNERVEAIR